MKYVFAGNVTRRTLCKSRHAATGIVLSALMALSLIQLQPVNGQRRGYGKAIEVAAGRDLFKTVKGTQFRFAEEFTIPADFFEKGSRRFAGTVSFKGVPIGSFQDQKMGSTDTIVERKKGATFDASNSRATVPIEVVALSLESTRPISVQVGRKVQLWKVRVELSKSRPSEGTMTIIRRNNNGGTFNSEFVVYGLFTFTRQGDGAERKLDVGEMRLDAKSIEKITLRTAAAPWTENCGPTGQGFCAMIKSNNPVVINEGGRLVTHNVIF